MGCGGRSMYAEENGQIQHGSLVHQRRYFGGNSSFSATASHTPAVAKHRRPRRSPTPPPDQSQADGKVAVFDDVGQIGKQILQASPDIAAPNATPTARPSHTKVRGSGISRIGGHASIQQLSGPRVRARPDSNLCLREVAPSSSGSSPQVVQAKTCSDRDHWLDSAEDSEPLDFEKRDSLKRVVHQLVEPSRVSSSQSFGTSQPHRLSSSAAHGGRRRRISQSHSLGPAVASVVPKPRRRSSQKPIAIDGSSSSSAANHRERPIGYPTSNLENDMDVLLPRPRPTKTEDKRMARASRRSRSQPSPEHETRLCSPSHKIARPNRIDAMTILTRGSELQGMVIVLWDENDPDISENFGLSKTRPTSESFKFEDADGLPGLSSNQGKSLHAWQRFSEFTRPGKGTSMGKPVVLSSAPSSENIKQGFVGDCSFLSALSVLAEYERKFDRPVLSSLIYPKDFQDRPTFNEVGKYGCRMFLNGAMRKIVIDDRVPVRRNGDLLCAHSANPREMWVTLLEKTYAKIMGGSFDIQGSNPGIDVFHLTSWIPETIYLSTKDDSLPKEVGPTASLDELFTRAEKGYREGGCVLCVGTAGLPDAKPDKEARRLGHVEGVSASTGLVAHHAYPVLECRCIGQHRLLHLKNPWGRISWFGSYGPGDAVTWQKVLEDLDGASLVDTFGYDPSAAAEENDDGHFWIEWKDILRFFSHLYICWSPLALGLHCMEAHACWDPAPYLSNSSLDDDTYLVAFNPQYLLHLEEPLPEYDEDDLAEGIWVLLSRHFKIRSELASRYVTTHIFEGSARLCCPDAPRKTGVYSNGECAFVRLSDIGRERRDFVLVISQYDSKAAFNFTLQVYSRVRCTLTALAPLIPKGFASSFVKGEWTAETAGGCSNDRWAYFQNPHWRLNVPSGGFDLFVLFVECSAEFCVNVRLFSGTVADPEKLRRAETSGAYRQGCCMLKVSSLTAGPYVVVVSAFKAGVCGHYRLVWHAPKAVDLFPQPHPFAVPLQRPLECLARRIKAGVRGHFRLSNKAEAVDAPIKRRTLFSVRLQCDFNQGLPPLLKLLREDPGEYLSESSAESYFTFSGAAVILLAEMRLHETCMLEAFVPNGGQGSVALYINSDGPVSLEDTVGENLLDL